MAPQPLVRTTAGSRALIVTAVVIALVAIAAFLFNAFDGDDEPATTTVASSGTDPTTATTGADGVAPPTADTVQLTANRVVPSSQLADFPADNLIDTDPTSMWQVGQEGVGASATFFFPEAVALDRIEFKNLSDEAQFRRNFRVRGVRISPDDTTRAVIVDLQDTRDVQVIPIQTTATLSLRIEVTSTYPGEAVEGQSPFKELAIEDIVFFGSMVEEAGG